MSRPAFNTLACTETPKDYTPSGHPVCFMCKGTEPKPKWIQATAVTTPPRVFCSKFCQYHYAMGSDMT